MNRMITSPANPRIKLARALQKRRARERSGLLFIEGVRLVQDAIAVGLRPETLFYHEAALRSTEVAALVAQFQPVAWAMTDEIMSTLADTITPQGLAAIIPSPHLNWPTAPTLLLVADGLRDPGNLGTLLRGAVAAGVEGVIMPSGTVDVWSDKVLRAGMGAHFRLPMRDGLSWDEILPLLDDLNVYVAAANGQMAYDAADWVQPAALIVGSEAHGPSPAAHNRASASLSIPMARAVESLNVAMAGSVMLFEASRQRRQATSG